MSTDKDIELKAKTFISLFFINDYKTAKQFAITAVREIIEVIEDFDENVVKRKEEYRPLEEYDFWKSVIKKIKSL